MYTSRSLTVSLHFIVLYLHNQSLFVPLLFLLLIPTWNLSYLFQMVEDWFSGSGPDGSGLSSEFSAVLTSDFGSSSGSDSDFESAWGTGEVYCPVCLENQQTKKGRISVSARALR